MTRIDYAELRQIPILRVADVLRLAVRRVGGATWAVKQTPDNSEDSLGHTSLMIFENTNTWHRFSEKESGGVYRGSTIDLCMHIHDCSLELAVEFLLRNFPQYHHE